MADTPQQPPKQPFPFEWVDTPAAQPLRVRGHRWQQAGFQVISAICPKCAPDKTLESVGARIRTEGHGHVHVNQPGRVICRCGAYLEVYLEGEEAAQP